jgi:hypothetical protein
MRNRKKQDIENLLTYSSILKMEAISSSEHGKLLDYMASRYRTYFTSYSAQGEPQRENVYLLVYLTMLSQLYYVVCLSSYESIFYAINDKGKCENINCEILVYRKPKR